MEIVKKEAMKDIGSFHRLAHFWIRDREGGRTYENNRDNREHHNRLALPSSKLRLLPCKPRFKCIRVLLFQIE
jgi:hypothetical protein